MVHYFKGIESKMTSTNNSLAEIITTFSQRYVEAFEAHYKHLPVTEYDELWPSPCQHSERDEETIFWLPVAIATQDIAIEDNEILSFSNIETALGITIHPDIQTYFTTLFSENIAATCIEGHLSLLFAWSKEDFVRLQQNFIGHILMKQKLKQSPTLFFAVTDEDDIIISVDNASGEVWVERVGCEPHKKLANSLVEFLLELEPLVAEA